MDIIFSAKKIDELGMVVAVDGNIWKKHKLLPSHSQQIVVQKMGELGYVESFPNYFDIPGHVRHHNVREHLLENGMVEDADFDAFVESGS